MTAFGMPDLRMSVVSARVSIPARPTTPRAFSQASSRPLRAEVRRPGEVGAEDRADRGGRGGGVDDLDVLAVDADDADVGEGEGDDLGGVGGVGQDLLVAGHRRVEADLADRGAGRADAEAFDHVAAREHQDAGRDPRPPAGARPVVRLDGDGEIVALAMRLCLSAALLGASSDAPDNISRRSWLTLSRCATS